MKKMIIVIISILVLILLYINSFSVLRIVGNKIHNEIHYKSFRIKKPENFSIMSVLDENDNAYALGIIPNNLFSFIYSGEINSIFNLNETKILTNEKENLSLPAFTKKYFFDFASSRYKKFYNFNLKDTELQVSIGFSDSNNAINNFNGIFKELVSNEINAQDGYDFCINEKDCIAYGKFKNLKVVFEEYKSEFSVVVYGMDNFIIATIVHTDNKKDIKLIKDSLLKIRNSIEQEYNRLNKINIK
jgi:glutaredoxin 2